MTIQGLMKYVNEALAIGIPVFILWGWRRTHQLKKQSDDIQWKEEVIRWILTFYGVCLLMTTVFRSDLSLVKMITRPYGWDTVNLIPFIELKKLWGYGYIWSFTYNVVGNIIWFIPLGFLLPLLEKKWGLIKIVGIGMLLSLGIELLQFICVTGISDVDDVIFNTLGTLVGYGFYKIAYTFYRNVFKLKTT